MNDLFADALKRYVERTGATPDCSPDTDGRENDSYTQYIRTVWKHIDLTAAPRKPVFLYGAGRHTARLLEMTADIPLANLRGVFDDNPGATGFDRLPVVEPKSHCLERGTLILLSSDRYEDELHAKAMGHFGDAATIIRLYEGLPRGPYDQPESTEAVAIRQAATAEARQTWGGSAFVGPYEQAGYVTGFLQEQWLWEHRNLLGGHVLDMSTPRHWHGWIYELADVTRVSVSSLTGGYVTKLGHASAVDIPGDFCDGDPPTKDNEFDTVLCLSILEHCTDPTQLLRNLHRVLKDSGTLFVAVPFVCPDGHQRPDFWRFGQDGLRLLASRAGFTDIATGGLGDAGEVIGHLLGMPQSATDDHDGIPLQTFLIANKG